MKINDKSASYRTRTPLARMLACVLLTGIIYSATFGVAHSHGNISSGIDTNRAANSAGQASSSSVTPFRSHSYGDQCLICLLHRQFSNSTIHAPFFLAKSYTQAAFVLAPTFFYYSSPIVSRPIARLSGRAPPVNRG